MTDRSNSTNPTRGIDRRKALAAIAAAPAAVAIAVTPAGAGLVALSASDQADKLWADRLALVMEQRELARQIDDASERLPWWAKEGPSHLLPDGTFGGPISGWPAIENATPPFEGYRLIRPSQGSLQRHRAALENLYGEPHARAWYRAGLREIARLKKRRDAEQQRVGLSELYGRMDAMSEAIRDADHRFYAAAQSGSLNAVAALALLELCLESSLATPLDSNDYEVVLVRTVLEGLRPHLSGPIAESVDVVLNRSVATFGDIPFMPS